MANKSKKSLGPNKDDGVRSNVPMDDFDDWNTPKKRRTNRRNKDNERDDSNSNSVAKEERCIAERLDTHTVHEGRKGGGKDKKIKSRGSKAVELENASGGGPNAGFGVADGEVKKDASNGLRGDPGRDVEEYRHLTQEEEFPEGIGDGGGAVGETDGKTRKKTVRFHDVPSMSTKYVYKGRHDWKADPRNPRLTYGRYSTYETATIKYRVFRYIRTRGWEIEDGLKKVLHGSHLTEARNCWTKITKCLPLRSVKSLQAKAQRIFRSGKQGKWSTDELEKLKKLHDMHGNSWTKISKLIGRSADLCKDKWRHLRLVPTRTTGRWKQNELDKLCKLVRRSLKRVIEPPLKGFDRREVRENIHWEWISGKIQRDSTSCAGVWYNRLSSQMISTKQWVNDDDRFLLRSLMELNVISEEHLDWDTVLDHRGGDVCIRRWKEMTKHLQRGISCSFQEKLKLLAKRYASHLLKNFP